MDSIKTEIMIHLEGERAENGRIYITSPDLRGFYFVLEEGEDPIEAMMPTLKIFIPVYLKAAVEAY